MTTRHLDLGCGPVPRNPYDCDEVHAVDLFRHENCDPKRFRQANLSLEPIPHAESSFDSISAFDFLEHIPRVLGTNDGRGTRLPFIELMDEIYRVLKPNGRFYALTPAYPREAAFLDPTHVNFIARGTWKYFCGNSPLARMYGYRGNFQMLRNEWGMVPEAFSAVGTITWQRRLRRWRLSRRGRLSHLVWEFVCVKPAT